MPLPKARFSVFEYTVEKTTAGEFVVRRRYSGTTIEDGEVGRADKLTDVMKYIPLGKTLRAIDRPLPGRVFEVWG